jgi:hypothetical protein
MGKAFNANKLNIPVQQNIGSAILFSRGRSISFATKFDEAVSSKTT